jgi:hypothetical protein
MAGSFGKLAKRSGVPSSGRRAGGATHLARRRISRERPGGSLRRPPPRPRGWARALARLARSLCGQQRPSRAQGRALAPPIKQITCRAVPLREGWRPHNRDPQSRAAGPRGARFTTARSFHRKDAPQKRSYDAHPSRPVQNVAI